MAAKRTRSKKTSSTRTKMTAKSSSKRTSSAKKSSRENRQGQAVVLFAVSVFLLFAVIIPANDAAVWNAIHTFILGTFGLCAYLVPVMIGYIAVMLALGKDTATVAKHVGLTTTFVLIVEALLEVFTADTSGIAYMQAIKAAYTHGAALSINGGAVGAVVGYPLEVLLSDIGAKITLILLTVVLIMLISKATLMSLWRPFQKTAEFTREHVKKTREKFEEAFDEAGEEENEVSSKSTVNASRIDINMGDGYADVPPEKRDPKEAFEEAAEELKEERNRPQLRIDDIIGRAIENKEAATSKEAPPAQEAVPTMTHEEIRQEEAAVAQQIEDQESVIESYTYPPISLLKKPKAADDRMAREEMQMNAELLVQTLKEFGISARVIDISRGPSVTRYELQPNAGVKISRITGLADDIALRLATTGVRIEAPIPNKAAIGIEVPNKVRGGVGLRELIDSDEFSEQQSRLSVAIGRDISGQIVTADLAAMPHLLIAGTTGSGKSVCTNSMIQSVLYHSSPEEVRMILIDPKRVEFSIYNGIPHLLVPVVTDPRKAAGALGWAVTEMLKRYNTFAENNVRDIKSYNKLAKSSDTLHTMPFVLIVIDELSDLMMAAGKEVEDAIVRLAQMARAAGMHLVIATQRPSVDVITGLIKANIPSRLALTVASAVDSRTILDAGGADKLLGKGDMLFHPVGLSKPIRVQGCFVSDEEVAAVVEFLKTSSASQYDELVVEEINRQAEAADKAELKEDTAGGGGDSDDMLPQAIEVVVEAGQASTSLLQRRLRVGYARAGRLVDEMEQRGIVGPHEGSKPRQVLITRQQWLEMQSNQPDVSGE